MESIHTSGISRKASYTFLLLFVTSISFLGNEVQRFQSDWMIISFAVSFFSYLWILKYCQFSTNILFITGFLVRASLFFSLPNFSDDFYRFIWDGTLLKNQINPYGILPQEAVQLGIPGINSDNIKLLNSPGYYTVYPPLNQAIFWASAYFGGFGQLLLSTNVIRLVLFSSEIGSVLLLQKIGEKMKLPNANRLAYWFFLNPLIILEFTGNLHFESLVIFFVLLGVYSYYGNGILWQGVGFGLGIATKLVPMIFLPALLFKQWPKKGILVCLVVILSASITFLPMLNSAFITSMSNSLGLYFQNFEFNASIYFIVREIGFMVKGYNLIHFIGPWLAIATFLSITSLSIIGAVKKQQLPAIILFSLCLYYFFSTTVHPWYILTLVPFGLLSGYRFPIVWSGIVFLTYLGYREDGFQLPMYWVFIEYSLVFGFLTFEIIRKIRNERN